MKKPLHCRLGLHSWFGNSFAESTEEYPRTTIYWMKTEDRCNDCPAVRDSGLPVMPMVVSKRDEAAS